MDSLNIVHRELAPCAGRFGRIGKRQLRPALHTTQSYEPLQGKQAWISSAKGRPDVPATCSSDWSCAYTFGGPAVEIALALVLVVVLDLAGLDYDYEDDDEDDAPRVWRIHTVLLLGPLP